MNSRISYIQKRVDRIKMAACSALLFLFVTVLCDPLSAQGVKGKVTNQSGAPVPYATIYISEVRQGTTANVKGEYELRLAPGRYQITFQSMGYGQVIRNIEVSGQALIIDAVLPVQYYMIPEVRISATGEDPAYRIMRKAIGMAPYYQNNISYYKAEVYLKGNLLVNNIPGLVDRLMKKAAKEDEKEGITPLIIKEGDVFFMESYNEVEFTAPDRYNQKVISINSTFPDEDDADDPMGYINTSFYKPLVVGMAVSPLSPQAFSYYRFQYLGATVQGSHTVNKIRVIPKMKSQQVFDGIIYIIEDLWCIHSLDLNNDNMAGKINVKQIYIPVREDIWMPVSHNFILNFGILGIRADVGYTGSIKYLEVRPNTSIRKPETLTTDFYGRAAETEPVEEVSKSQQKIEELLKKDDLNNRDMLKLAKLMDQETKKTQPDSVRNNLEVTSNVSHTVEKDAGKKDSAYWAEVRPIPLSDVEARSIVIRDSIKTVTTLQKSTIKRDTVPGVQKKPKSKFSQGVDNITFGHTWSDTTGTRFHWGGLLNLNNLSFNTVDGFNYGIDFRLTKSWKEGRTLNIAPDLRWAFSRESLNWRVNSTYNFNRKMQQSLFFNMGMTTRDLATGGSVNMFLNSVGSLFFEKNFLKLYGSEFFSAGFSTDLINGMNLTLTAAYDNRRVLQNTTSFSIIKTNREYTPNIPVSIYLDSTADAAHGLRDQRHFDFSATASYTPRMKYRMRNGSKIYLGSDWPTFRLTWEHGINEFRGESDRYRHYDMIRADISKRHEVGALSSFWWRIRTGGFLDNRNVPYHDFSHFNTQPLPILIDNYIDAFRLPAYYSLSTPEFYGEVHVKYTTPYLLLKYLPGLTKTLSRENISISYLGSRFHENYTEFGYGLSELFFVGELGVYAGFEDLKFKSIGARLVISLN